MISRSLSLKTFALVVAPILFMVLLFGMVVERQSRKESLRELEENAREKLVLMEGQFVDGPKALSAKNVQKKLDQIRQHLHQEIEWVTLDGVVWGAQKHSSISIPNQKDAPEVLQALSLRDGKSIRLDEVSNEKTFYFARRVDSKGKTLGILRLSVSEAYIQKHLKPFRQVILVFLGIGILIALAVAGRLHLSLTRPLLHITDVAQKIKQGRLVHRSIEQRKDIIGALGRSINHMWASLLSKIAEAQKEQEELDAILMSMTEGVVAIDHESRILFCNSSAKKFLGIQEKEVEKKLLEELVPLAKIHELIRDVQKSKQVPEMEIMTVRNHQEIYLVAEAHPFGGVKEEGIILTVRDVTEARRLEKVRQDFVANASHELKTPLAAMRGYVDILLESPPKDSKSRKRYLKKISENVERLIHLSEDLLRLSRAESKRPQTVQAFDIVSATKEVVEEYKPLAQKKGLEFKAEIFSDSMDIPGDRQSWTQICENILDNAIQYTESPGQISVSLQKEGNYVKFEVTDTGIGIPKAEQERIFERFYRLDRDGLGPQGTGLGLSIVKHLVTQFKGKIGLESEIGKGSRFVVKIPEHFIS